MRFANPAMPENFFDHEYELFAPAISNRTVGLPHFGLPPTFPKHKRRLPKLALWACQYPQVVATNWA